VKAEDYSKLVDSVTPNSQMIKDCIFAFVIGGLICVLGQGITDICKTFFYFDSRQAGTWTSIVLIFLSVLLTGIGVYDKIAKFAGAGTLVPITGFANAVASPAIEFKSEGFVLGMGTKLFTIAGSVIVYGTVSAFIYGIIYYIFSLM